ncbi:uncharacterized protein LOC135490612 [Lineus longissimus]|uniref:uncharacterized protein LOC135490612 n=1 Tax=Lineus longissimus TaxID=88925 RepID=UPI002B4F2C19
MPKDADEKYNKEALKNSGPFKAAFYCKRCNFKWVSYDSWPGTSQVCNCCNRGIPPEIYLTPYQGKGRRYGDYSCNNCGYTWSSAYSWANTYQQCKKCQKHVYPKSQRKLQKSADDVENKKPHHQKLCGKCQELGYSCRFLQEQEVEGESVATTFLLQGQQAGNTATRRRSTSYDYNAVPQPVPYENFIPSTRRGFHSAVPSRVTNERVFPRVNVEPEETASDSPSFLKMVCVGLGLLIIWTVFGSRSN